MWSIRINYRKKGVLKMVQLEKLNEVDTILKEVDKQLKADFKDCEIIGIRMVYVHETEH